MDQPAHSRPHNQPNSAGGGRTAKKKSISAPKKTSERHRFIKDIEKLPYYSKLPKNYKWPYLRDKRKLEEEVRIEDFGVELRQWQLGLMQLASMVLLFLLITYFIQSIFNNPGSGRSGMVHTIIDAFLLNYIRHTLLANLPYLILLFIGTALLTKGIFLLWRYIYVNGKNRGWPDMALTVGTTFYFGIWYFIVPTIISIQVGTYLYRTDIRLLVVYFLAWFLIYPYATLGTFTILAKKAKTAYALLSANLIIMVLSWLIIFNIISEDIQQSVSLPTVTRMAPALMFGVMFGAYFLITRQYIVYKYRTVYTVDRFDERLKENIKMKTRYLQTLSRTLTKSLVMLLITVVAAALLTLIPVAFLYISTWYGPVWLSQSYEFNSVYGLVLPFIILMLLLIMGRSVYEMIRQKLDEKKVQEASEPKKAAL